MVTTEFNDSYYTTVDDIRDELTSSHPRIGDPDKDHYLCDFCSKGVPFSKNPTVAAYLADYVPIPTNNTGRMVNRTRTITHIATYCEDCSHKLLFFPHKTTCEARVYLTFSGREVTDVEFTDVSNRDDGIPWDPIELTERITAVPAESFAESAQDTNMSPENVMTFFMSLNTEVDPRQLFEADGTIKPKPLGRARKRFRKIAEESEGDLDRDKFKERVRG